MKDIKLDSKLLRWMLMGALAFSVAIFFIILFSGLSLLAGQSRKMVSLKSQSQTDDALLTNLEQTKKQVDRYSYFQTVAKDVIPNDKDQASAVLEINQIAAKAGVAIQSITFPASNLGTSSLSTGSAGTAAAAGSTAASISQAQTVAGIPGLYSLAITVALQPSSSAGPAKSVTYAKMLSFLDSIENNQRTAQITNINIQQEPNSPYLNFSLVINIFIRPGHE